jgi:hypothetical protein
MFGRKRRQPEIVPTETVIGKVDEAGRQLSAARRAVKLQHELVNHPDEASTPLPVETCVLCIAIQEGWADNPVRIALIQEAARKLKVNA